MISELGSGTGLVGLSLAAASALSLIQPKEICITDKDKGHVNLIRQNAKANGLAFPSSHRHETGLITSTTATAKNHQHQHQQQNDKTERGENRNSHKTELSILEYDWSSDKVENLGPLPFDVILGTDVAYCPELYAPLIKVKN